MMDACVSLRSLLETLRIQRRRASLSLSSLSSSNTSMGGVSPEDIRLDGKLEVRAPLVPLNEMRSLTSCCVQAGILTFLVKEVEHLVRGSAWFQMDVSQCEQCGRSPNDLLQLESELHLTQEAADKLQRLLTDKTEEAKRREEEATSFKNQVTSHLHQLKIANSWHFYSKC